MMMETSGKKRQKMKGGDVTRPKDAPNITIRGLVVPVEWDDKGNILNLVISTFDEDEYLIELDQRGKQLNLCHSYGKS
jgi:hypothetical protein